mmetsp:Transcript_23438/g.65431  ORF Transcript_23438/g.65431 Transcript_23438/m.65431 type:complete len:90 (-) Transcript_23438:1430-1699(-)
MKMEHGAICRKAGIQGYRRVLNVSFSNLKPKDNNYKLSTTAGTVTRLIGDLGANAYVDSNSNSMRSINLILNPNIGTPLSTVHDLSTLF